jgi:hypothetical protein
MAKRSKGRGKRMIGSKVCVGVQRRRQCAIVKASGKLRFVKNTTPGCGCASKKRKSRKGR